MPHRFLVLTWLHGCYARSYRWLPLRYRTVVPFVAVGYTVGSGLRTCLLPRSGYRADFGLQFYATRTLRIHTLLVLPVTTFYTRLCRSAGCYTLLRLPAVPVTHYRLHLDYYGCVTCYGSAFGLRLFCCPCYAPGLPVLRLRLRSAVLAVVHRTVATHVLLHYVHGYTYTRTVRLPVYGYGWLPLPVTGSLPFTVTVTYRYRLCVPHAGYTGLFPGSFTHLHALLRFRCYRTLLRITTTRLVARFVYVTHTFNALPTAHPLARYATRYGWIHGLLPGLYVTTCTFTVTVCSYALRLVTACHCCGSRIRHVCGCWFYAFTPTHAHAHTTIPHTWLPCRTVHCVASSLVCTPRPFCCRTFTVAGYCYGLFTYALVPGSGFCGYLRLYRTLFTHVPTCGYLGLDSTVATVTLDCLPPHGCSVLPLPVAVGYSYGYLPGSHWLPGYRTDFHNTHHTRIPTLIYGGSAVACHAVPHTLRTRLFWFTHTAVHTRLLGSPLPGYHMVLWFTLRCSLLPHNAPRSTVYVRLRFTHATRVVHGYAVCAVAAFCHTRCTVWFTDFPTPRYAHTCLPVALRLPVTVTLRCPLRLPRWFTAVRTRLLRFTRGLPHHRTHYRYIALRLHTFYGLQFVPHGSGLRTVYAVCLRCHVVIRLRFGYGSRVLVRHGSRFVPAVPVAGLPRRSVTGYHAHITRFATFCLPLVAYGSLPCRFTHTLVLYYAAHVTHITVYTDALPPRYTVAVRTHATVACTRLPHRFLVTRLLLPLRCTLRFTATAVAIRLVGLRFTPFGSLVYGCLVGFCGWLHTRCITRFTVATHAFTRSGYLVTWFYPCRCTPLPCGCLYARLVCYTRCVYLVVTRLDPVTALPLPVTAGYAFTTVTHTLYTAPRSGYTHGYVYVYYAAAHWLRVPLRFTRGYLTRIWFRWLVTLYRTFYGCVTLPVVLPLFCRYTRYAALRLRLPFCPVPQLHEHRLDAVPRLRLPLLPRLCHVLYTRLPYAGLLPPYHARLYRYTRYLPLPYTVTFGSPRGLLRFACARLQRTRVAFACGSLRIVHMRSCLDAVALHTVWFTPFAVYGLRARGCLDTARFFFTYAFCVAVGLRLHAPSHTVVAGYLVVPVVRRTACHRCHAHTTHCYRPVVFMLPVTAHARFPPTHGYLPHLLYHLPTILPRTCYCCLPQVHHWLVLPRAY